MMSKKHGIGHLRALLKPIPSNFLPAIFVCCIAYLLCGHPAFANEPKNIKVKLFHTQKTENQSIRFSWMDYVLLVDGKRLSIGTCAEVKLGQEISVKIGGTEYSAQRMTLTPNRDEAIVLIDKSGMKPRQFTGTIRIQGQDNGWAIVNEMALEDYVAGVVDAETVKNDPEYLDLMAIVVRSRAYSGGPHPGGVFCDTTCCMLYHGQAGKAAKLAAKRTEGLVISYDGKLCPVFFHACCGGYTRRVEDAIPHAKPHPALQGGRDRNPEGKAWCAMANHYKWKRRIGYDAFHQIIAQYFKEKRLGGLSYPITVLRPEPDAPLLIFGQDGEKKIDPEGFRIFTGRRAGWNLLLSDRFKIITDSNHYVFDGKGFGHRVGLCQAGALAQVKRGVPIKDILQTYFPGSQILPVDQLKNPVK